MKKFVSLLLCVAVLAGCGISKTGKGAIIGTGAGAGLGAGIGALIGGEKGAAIGAAIGAGVGAGTGTIIGRQMDKKAEELAKLENVQVETVKDANGLEAIKVTFDSGILFDFNKSTLRPEAKASLDKFATEMSDMTETGITVYGHTDNVGSEAANRKISLQRAESVGNYLNSKGIAKSRITMQGMGYDQPVADNSTEAGRAQNRRVEVFITANEKMIEEAAKQAGE
ncbi:MAG: OmpA family protein [Bacteroidales bacterium]|nr:OmpA family protein [Bacteroidales bacterium]MBO6237318.1 OmpA family protein [Bacteroidales bacterium]